MSHGRATDLFGSDAPTAPRNASADELRGILFAALQDGDTLTLLDLMKRCGGASAPTVRARLQDLTTPAHGGHTLVHLRGGTDQATVRLILNKRFHYDTRSMEA